jgi:hypothetical protein
VSRSLHDDSLRVAPARDRCTANERVPEQVPRDSREQEGKTVYKLLDQNYRLSSRQSEMLQDLGAFRTITEVSLRKHIYHGNEERFRNELRNLADQGLVAVHPAPTVEGGYLSLTRAGKKLTEVHLRTNADQTLYSGIVKKRELRHDAAFYDVYQREAQRLSNAGGTVRRVMLDFELKKQVNRELAKIQNLSTAEREGHRQEIADAHSLKIVGGKIQFPDVRVEYESRNQERCTVDLECVTGHYKVRQVAAKAAAGFKLYNQDYRGRSAERGEDLIGEVMSL